MKVTPRVSSKSFISHLDEEELHATSDGQLLAHVVGEISDVGLEEPGLSSLLELTASGRKSKSDRSKKCRKSSKRAKFSRSPIVSSWMACSLIAEVLVTWLNIYSLRNVIGNTI